MKGKEKNQLSWKEAFRLNNRAFRLIYRKYPKMIFSRLIGIVWDAFTPYASIYLSARIVGELAGARDVERLRKLVIITLGAEACLALAGALLTKWKNYTNAGTYFKVEQFYEEKLLDMDFIDIDDSKIHDLYYKILQFRSGETGGLCACCAFLKGWFRLCLPCSVVFCLRFLSLRAKCRKVPGHTCC